MKGSRIMACFVCKSESPYEVCNQCIRAEKVFAEQKWTYKASLFGAKEDCKISVSSYRISGCSLISSMESGSNGRFDTFNHYVGNVKDIKIGEYNKKPSLILHIVNTEKKLDRYIILPGMEDMEKIHSAILSAKG